MLKKIVAIILTLILISGIMPLSFAEKSDIDISGDFTENGYVNDYFFFRWDSIFPENNIVTEQKNNNGIDHYLEKNEFYTIYKDEKSTISLYKRDCFGEATSESQFLQLLCEKENVFPWSDNENESEFNLKLYNLGFYECGGEYGSSIPGIICSYEDNSNRSIGITCFIRNDYVLLVSDEYYAMFKNSFNYNYKERIKNDILSWRDIESVCTADVYAVGVKKDGSVLTAGIIPHYADDVREWINVKKIIASNFSDELAGLTKDGKLLLASKHDRFTLLRTDNNGDKEKIEMSYSDVDRIIDIDAPLEQGLTVFALRDDGSVYLFDEGYGDASIFDNIAELAKNERIDRIRAGSSTGDFCLISNLGNVYHNGQKIDSDVRDCDYSGSGALLVIKNNGEVDYRNILFSEDYAINFNNIAQAVCMPYDLLVMLDNKGNILCSNSAMAPSELSSWKKISSIFHDAGEYCIGVRQDGTAVVAFSKQFISKEVSEKWSDERSSGVLYKILEEPITDCVYFYFNYSAYEKDGGTADGKRRLWIAGEDKKWINVDTFEYTSGEEYSNVIMLEVPSDIYYYKVTREQVGEGKYDTEMSISMAVTEYFADK